MIARLLGAIQFLTVLPVHSRTAPPGQSALFFPLVGAALGAAGGLVLEVARTFVPVEIAALLVICFWALITGGLHEDGFADVADAFRAGRPREKILAILKDSRIGAHGGLALVLISLVRWQALSSNAAVNPSLALAASLAVSRASMVVVAWLTPPAGSGLGFEFSRTLNTSTAIGVLLQAFLWAAFSGTGILLLWYTSLVIAGGRIYFTRRIGGVTGDCLGACALVVETGVLLLFTCLRCM
jgi:adenosylcobinamide-GDP ribazoletransferase